MEISGKILLGRVGKPHGLKGHIRVNLSKDIKELLQPEALFILDNDSLLPYFIRETEVRSDGGLLIAFDDVDTPEQARKLTGKEMYVLEKHVAVEESDLHELIGYQLLDAAGEVLGQVVDVLEFPAQVMLEIRVAKTGNSGNKESSDRSGEETEEGPLVPLVEEWVVGIDHTIRQLQMDLPDGLLQIQDSE